VRRPDAAFEFENGFWFFMESGVKPPHSKSDWSK